MRSVREAGHRCLAVKKDNHRCKLQKTRKRRLGLEEILNAMAYHWDFEKERPEPTETWSPCQEVGGSCEGEHEKERMRRGERREETVGKPV